MSKGGANAASGLSPLTAARATFALKAGVWFRRGRLVIVSPVRHAYWPLSGRNSTYPAVQISKASSPDGGSPGCGYGLPRDRGGEPGRYRPDADQLLCPEPYL